jgi:ketosteroid isomerase-like protein
MLRVMFTAALLMGMLLPVAAQNKDQTGDETLILALESAWNQAELHHDAKAVTDIVADTFISVDHHGKLLNKAQYLADLKDESFHPEQISNENPKVYMYGNTAIVTSAYRTRGTDSGQPFVHHGRFTDTWVKLNGKWVCVADQETLIGK